MTGGFQNPYNQNPYNHNPYCVGILIWSEGILIGYVGILILKWAQKDISLLDPDIE